MRRIMWIASVLAVTAAPSFGIEPPPAGGTVVFDARAGFEPWRSIDDVVMGGVSSSTMAAGEGFASFRGEVSLANNGGFASVRSRPAELDLGGRDGLQVAVRGDGRRYGFRLRTTDSFDGPSYQVAVQPPAGEWSVLTLRFADFVPVFRGRAVPGWSALDPARIRTLGLIISDQQAGPFRLDIAWIVAVADDLRTEAAP